MDYKSEVEDDEGYLNEQKGEDEEKKEADLNDDSELGEEKEETKWDDIDWGEDNYNEREKTKWDDIDWSEDNYNEREKTKWDEIDWNEDFHGDRDKNEKDKNDGQNEEYNKEDYVENVESQSTSTVLTNKIEEIEGDMEHQEQEEEVEIRPEEYKDDTEPIVNTEEIEFIKDVEELAEHAREIKAEDEIVEPQAEQENAAYYAELYYEKLKEKVVVKDQDSIEEQETEELRQEVTEEFKSEECINEASKEITSPEEFEYLWGIREKLDREGKSPEEIEEVMHEAEEMYETLKNAEKLYEEQELEKLKLVDHEDEASVEDLKEDLGRVDLVEQAVELEENLVQQGKSQEEIDMRVEEAIETTKFEEKLETIIEQQELEKLKLVDHEDEASEEDLKEDLDRVDLVEQAVELEENLVQQGMSQEEIDTRVEEAIETTKFEEKLETIIEKEQESIVNKKLKKHDLEINEQNSNENIDNEENLEVLKPELDAIESESEGNKDFLEESTKIVSEESDEEETEHLQELYRQETGRRPIYSRKKTNGYSQWLEQRELGAEKIKISKSESEKIKEIEEEDWKTTLKQWIRVASDEECNAELKSELKKALESYNEFEDLTRKFLELYEKSQYEKLSEKEKNILKSLTERLQGLGPIQLELLANIRAFKDYFYNHLWELMNRFFVIRVRSKFLNHISQKYKELKKEHKVKNHDSTAKNFMDEIMEELNNYPEEMYALNPGRVKREKSGCTLKDISKIWGHYNGYVSEKLRYHEENPNFILSNKNLKELKTNLKELFGNKANHCYGLIDSHSSGHISFNTLIKNLQNEIGKFSKNVNTTLEDLALIFGYGYGMMSYIRQHDKYVLSKERIRLIKTNIKLLLGPKANNVLKICEKYVKKNPDLPDYANQKYTITNPNLFHNIYENNEIMYWFGWLCSDGWVSQAGNTHYQIQLKLKREDRIIIERFANAIGYDQERIFDEIYLAENENGEIRPTYSSRVMFGCKPMWYNLKKLGIFDFKNSEKVPRIIKQLINKAKLKNPFGQLISSKEGRLALNFLMGFYDGDGNYRGGMSARILNTKRTFLEEIVDLFNIPNKVNINSKYSIDKKTYKNIWKTGYQLHLGTDLFNQMLLSYENSLQRKRPENYKKF